MKKTWQRLTPYLLVIPAVMILLVFMGFPIVYGLRLSFFKWSLLEMRNSPIFVGLDNFRALFQSLNFRSSISTTCMFVFSVVLVQLLLGLAVALLLEGKLPGVRFFRSVFMLPVMISPVVVGVTWKYLYDPNFGAINFLLQQCGLPAGEWLSSESTALLSVVMTEIWQWTPFVFLILLSGLQSVPGDLAEAGVMDGANYLQTLIHIKLPCMRNIIRLVVTLRLIESMRSMVVIFIMTSGGPGLSTLTLPMYIYKDAFVNQQLGTASASAIVLMAMLVIMTALVRSKEPNEKHSQGGRRT